MSIQSVIECLNRSRDSYPDRNVFLHKCRMELEPFVYSHLRNTYGPAMDKAWDTCTIPRVSDKAILIVERRCHPNLEFTIKNAVYFAKGYSLHIICSQANGRFVQEVCGSQLPNIHIHPVFKDIGTVERGKQEYNSLLKQAGFWSSFSEDYFLCIETDSYLLRPIPPIVYDYPYVASEWNWSTGQGGGLSHRTRSFMLEVCGLQGKHHESQMQDTFANEGLLALGYKYLEGIFCESTCEHGIVGTHQWWTFACECPAEHLEAYLSVFLTLCMST